MDLIVVLDLKATLKFSLIRIWRIASLVRYCQKEKGKKARSTATQQEGSGVLHTLPGLRQSLHWGDRQDIERTTKRTQETSHKWTHRRLSSSRPCPPTTSRHWLGNTLVLDYEDDYFKRIGKEALQIKERDNFNQDSGLAVSPIWSTPP